MKGVMVLLGVLVLAGAPVWAVSRATVESIDILIAESFPVQVFAILRGYLPDGCTTIADIRAGGPVDRVFHIEIVTQRPTGMACTQALVAFERSLPLKADGLAAGTYEVIAQSAHASFTLRQDNLLE